jgi:hypothetical protein
VNFATMTTAVVQQGGFDTDASNTPTATVESWINEKYRELVARSLWRKILVDLGPTVANQAQYAIDADIVDIRALRLDSGRRWLRVSTEQLFDLQSDDAWLSRAEGAYAPNFEADGDAVVELWPVPDTAGQAINTLSAVYPADLTGADVPKVPVDFHEAIVSGAIGLGLLRIEENAAAAAPYDLLFEAAVSRLTRRANSRVGSGPTQARVG